MSNALVIIPTYNERENIQGIIDAVFSQPKDFDLLIVDDGSPDGTAEVVKDLQKNYNTNEVRLHLMQ
ncbi:MAG: glycosyltransferase, partial [Cyclobacteriaceae bacterium]|nr:glycosyltransferase [Cyclobacteriaceae bacterium]